MKAFTQIAGLVGLVATGALADPPPQMPEVSMIKTSSPYQCAPGSSVGVSVQGDSLELRLPSVSFGDIGHGRTDESMICELDIELVLWWYKYRVAISDVTYSGRLNLTNGVELYRLNAKTVFNYIHFKGSHPIVQPEIRNLSSAVMIDNNQDTAIGGDGDFLDDFEVTAKAPELVWSPCFDGGEGQGFDQTQLKIQIGGTTRDPGDKGEGQFVDGGLTVKFGLVWEECYPDRDAKHAWGVSRIDDWETCTYREENNQTSRVIPRDVNLKNGLDVRVEHQKRGHSEAFGHR